MHIGNIPYQFESVAKFAKTYGSKIHLRTWAYPSKASSSFVIFLNYVGMLKFQLVINTPDVNLN